MHKTVFPILAFALILWSAPAAAGDFALFGSYADTEDLEETVGGGVKVGIDLGATPLQLDLRATYLPDLTEDFESFVDDPGDDPGPFTNDIEAIPLDVGVTYDFGPRTGVTPYLGGGGTYFLLDAERGELDDEAGFYVVGGLEVNRRGGGVGFFAEALYREVEATVDHEPGEFDEIDDIDFQDLDERDLDVGGFGVNAGLIWSF